MSLLGVNYHKKEKKEEKKKKTDRQKREEERSGEERVSESKGEVISSFRVGKNRFLPHDYLTFQSNAVISGRNNFQQSTSKSLICGS